jgi:hypothetical protein
MWCSLIQQAVRQNSVYYALLASAVHIETNYVKESEHMAQKLCEAILLEITTFPRKSHTNAPQTLQFFLP